MPAPQSVPTLAVRRIGTPHSSLPPVVLLHGFASSAAEDFGDWGDTLAAAGRTGVLVDLPGHGDSPAVAGADASTDAVVRALSAALGADEVDVVGYSLGARLAWELPAATGRVRRLVLGGLSPFEPFAAVDVVAVARAVHGESPADPFVGMMAGMVSAPGCDVDALLALIAGLGSQPFAPGALGASRPDVPTLFVAGDADQLTTGLEGLAATVPGARYATVPGDHLAALHSPAFRAAALAHLA
ncbi:alpha/beta hydrolase [Leifsonia sp. LS1]|uniref:alpha/beta fold hydrolase n=1 Tax=Leifsonia sp. LS1 TaxID=2828483 RepID=UPI001CFEF1FF|nr:alpha/beta fold hydrolase [Leifsonia sp. LS1]GIT81917.1 alpha/beta hydrolase [Leifsonia sp. LS1]